MPVPKSTTPPAEDLIGRDTVDEAMMQMREGKGEENDQIER